MKTLQTVNIRAMEKGLCLSHVALIAVYVLGIVSTVSRAQVPAKPNSPVDDQKVYTVGFDNVTPPVRVPPAKPDPTQPSTNSGSTTASHGMNDIARAFVTFYVEKDGSVSHIVVVNLYDKKGNNLVSKPARNPDTSKLLDDVIDEIKQWKFNPSTKKGVAVRASTAVQMDFQKF
jgi:hypothetical protein